MTKPMVRIVDANGIITDREMNAAELAQHKLDQEAGVKRNAEAEANAKAKAALLAKLGITEAEAELLLA